MAYVVEYPGNYWLRGTTATGDIDRATKFETEQDAQKALTANSKFLKPAARKAAKIVKVAT